MANPFREVKYFLMLTLFPPLVYAFLLLLRATLRIEHINRETIENQRLKGANHIYCFWHGRLLLMPFAYRGQKAKVLISRHRDGEFITRIIGLFGLGAIRGSFRKGSVSSLRQIIADLRRGVDVAITPDGPKGPRYEVKQGIIELAKLTRKAIVPVTYGASKKKLFIHGTGLSFPYLFPGSSFSGATLSSSHLIRTAAQ